MHKKVDASIKVDFFSYNMFWLQTTNHKFYGEARTRQSDGVYLTKMIMNMLEFCLSFFPYFLDFTFLARGKSLFGL